MQHPKTIEYFYSAHSAFAYLGAWELQRIADAAGAEIIHRPFDFAPVMAAAGGQNIQKRSRSHIHYFFGREIRRWSELRNLPLLRHRPTYHDHPLALANGAIIAAGADAGRMSRAILQAHWRDDADFADPETLRCLADTLGLDGDNLIHAAGSATIQAQHRANTEEAIARSVFGSPTYFVEGDMFYGQDRLFMVERALQTPFGR
ncbi:2-hydroxychromene-2-carboxylate isomerase [Sulfitobacter sp. F26204]|uniref:2-hydroxychromene-2-carboxylate isomerase n=1 Tax=Sulfitobacter sp. F26204 TaxID=2996014 RepID=UPI00225E3CA3|nr:2-hydroxychromene-2-carboxylate isomerase [Sulfitobacter sp. F26204]MCX7561107.1 2-hydroxychromene-2-carboxylate isomerase [Sulfitobacter sp. F26204]